MRLKSFLIFQFLIHILDKTIIQPGQFSYFFLIFVASSASVSYKRVYYENPVIELNLGFVKPLFEQIIKDASIRCSYFNILRSNDPDMNDQFFVLVTHFMTK